MSLGPHSALLVPGLATGIGSLPHLDPTEAVRVSLTETPRLPFAPQLPNRSPREGMIAEWIVALPEVTVADDGSFSIDPSRVGVQGYSAGGNIGLNLLGRYDAGDPQAADPVQRFSSRPDFMALMCPWPNGKPIADYPVHKNPPPVFIASAEDDKTATTAFALEIATAVKNQGGKVQMFVVPTGGHGAFHYGASKGDGAKWPEAFKAMLESSSF